MTAKPSMQPLNPAVLLFCAAVSGAALTGCSSVGQGIQEAAVAADTAAKTGAAENAVAAAADKDTADKDAAAIAEPEKPANAAAVTEVAANTTEPAENVAAAASAATVSETAKQPAGLAYAGDSKSNAALTNTALAAVGRQAEFPPPPGDALPQTSSASNAEMTALIKRYAGVYAIPEALLHRVVHRESRYNPAAYNKQGYWGLMQISYPTAKSMGYQGPAHGLLDAETNIKYAGKYLRGAWLVAERDNDHAIRLYARGYYYDAKRKNMLHVLKP